MNRNHVIELASDRRGCVSMFVNRLVRERFCGRESVDVTNELQDALLGLLYDLVYGAG